ncbi:MAG: GHKL domain-containing protein [Balneolaceae bacterium]|nr:GHKL domain-containing protein [Balneolaceae bacterium]
METIQGLEMKTNDNTRIVILLILLFVFDGLQTVQAQELDLRFMHYGLEEGISQVTISAIAQDDKGFIWIGTSGGLNRYDGRNFMVYDNEMFEPNSLSDDNVLDICKDTEGNLWVGTANGLNYLNLRKQEFTQYFKESGNSSSISDNRVHDVLCESDGSVWIGTDKGLNKLIDREKGEFSRLDKNPEFSVPAVSLFRGADNKLWIGTYGKGLFYYENEEITHFSETYETNYRFLNDDINKVYQEENGNIWVSTTEDAVYKIHSEMNRVTHYPANPNDPNALHNSNAREVFQDSKGIIWLGTEDGLHQYRPSSDDFIRVSSDPQQPFSLSSNRIHAIFEDNQETIWIGTWTTGVNAYSYYQKQLGHYQRDPNNPEKSLSNNSLWGFEEDQEGNIWIATNNGLNKFNKKTREFQHYHHNPEDPNSLSTNLIFGVHEDAEGYLWLSSLNGINRFDPKTGKAEHYFHDPDDPNSLSINTMWDLFLDDKGRVWGATGGSGLDMLNPETGNFTHYNHDPDDPNSLNDQMVTVVNQDNSGKIWLGTQKGLNVFDEETGIFETFEVTKENPHSLAGYQIYDLHVDAKGNLWVGTGQGLNVVDPESKELLQYFTEEDGMAHNTVWCITEDEDGKIYLGTSFGLSVYNPETNSFQNYDQRDGIQANEFGVGAALTDSEGYIYIGGINGFNMFKPEALSRNQFAPPVVLTDFSLFNKSIPITSDENGEQGILSKSITYTNQIELDHTHDVFSFEFSALSYLTPEKNQFAYKMENFEENWNYVGNRNYATYTNLPAGEYTFRVKAANNDGVWNEEGVALQLVMTPPFWKTNWFYFIASVIVVGVAIGGYRWRVRSIYNQNQRLEKLVKERTNELQQTLKDLRDTRNKLVEKAHKAGMADIATGVLHNVGNILNSVNTSSSLIDETLEKTKLSGFEKANNLLRKHINEIDSFIAENPKGKKLMNYYLKLEGPLKEEQEKIKNYSKRLSDNIKLINEVIAAQQSYATANTNNDLHRLSEIVDDALMLNTGSTERHSITIKKEYNSSALVICQRTKLIHVLVNILKNAKEAMAENDDDNKLIEIKLDDDGEYAYLSISDNGHGITEKNRGKIFTQGFTTKDSGHGFGLHSSANYMKEMGSEIIVDSEGEGEGAVFTLKFELQEAQGGIKDKPK